METLATLRRIIFLISLPFFILGLMLPVYGKQIGASTVEIGLFFSAFSLMTVILRPLVGWGLDTFGRRKFFLAGTAGYALTMISFAIIDQTTSILLARIIQGISSTLLWLSASAITADKAKESERGVAFGRVTQASSQGSIWGTVLGFFILNSQVSLFGADGFMGRWRLLFLVYGAVSMFALILGWRGLSETAPDGEKTVSSLIRWSGTWILLLVLTLVTGASAAMLSPVLIIFLVEKLAVTPEILSFAFLPSAFVWAFLPAWFGKQADRFGRKPMMFVGLSAAALTSFLIPALANVLALAVLWAFQAACYAAGDPAEQALVADLTGKNQRGRAYGLYLMFADLGATIGPLGGAWLYQTFGASMPFYANGVILALCALVMLLFLQIPRQPIVLDLKP